MVTAFFYPPLLSTDNLFIISVCLVMALMFMVNPLLLTAFRRPAADTVCKTAGMHAAHTGVQADGRRLSLLRHYWMRKAGLFLPT